MSINVYKGDCHMTAIFGNVEDVRVRIDVDVSIREYDDVFAMIQGGHTIYMRRMNNAYHGSTGGLVNITIPQDIFMNDGSLMSVSPILIGIYKDVDCRELICRAEHAYVSVYWP